MMGNYSRILSVALKCPSFATGGAGGQKNMRAWLAAWWRFARFGCHAGADKDTRRALCHIADGLCSATQL
jgi:hypothetical protein